MEAMCIHKMEGEENALSVPETSESISEYLWPGPVLALKLQWSSVLQIRAIPGGLKNPSREDFLSPQLNYFHLNNW